MRKISKNLAVALVTLVAICLNADVVRLDFGTATSPVQDGFTKLTVDGGGAAVWSAEGKLESRESKIVRDWTQNVSSGRQMPPSPYFIEINCDYISSDSPASLRLQVPPGSYKVWILSGHGGGNRSQVWETVAECGGESGRVVVPGPIGMRKIELSGEADENGLAINFSTRSKWLVNAVVAAPASEWEKALADVIAPIWRDCSVLPAAELAKWKHLPPEFDDPEPEWDERQIQDGFALFSRPWAEPVWPNQFPRASEIDAPARAFASRNEYEPITFSVHPLRDFKEVDLSLSELRSDTGNVIPREDAQLRYVRYMNVRPNYSIFNIYYKAPDVLMPWERQSLEKGENLRVWITVYVRPHTPPGFYKGAATLSLDGAEREVPVTLRVLPVTLQKDSSLVFGQYYRHPLSMLRSAPDNYSREWWYNKAVSEHEHLRASGMNNITTGLWGVKRGDKWQMNFEYYQSVVDLARAHGFDTPLVCSIEVGDIYRRYVDQVGMGSHLRLVKQPPQEFFDELVEMVTLIQAEARRREWPELLYYPVDEPSTAPASVEFMTAVMKAIKQVPGARTYVTADPSYKPFDPMRPYVDVWCCQPFSISREDVLADMANRPGVEYWCYPNHISGENDHTTTIGARMTFGFGLWTSGFRALIPWIYQSNNGDQWNYLDGSSSDFVCRTDDDGNPIPVALWDAQREGIDDGRYIFTLENSIKRAEEAGFKAEAEEAKADLKAIEESIYLQPKYKDRNLWKAETFDVYRWMIAQHIIKLQALVTP